MSNAVETPLPRRDAVWRRPQVLLALFGFALFSALVLTRATALLEPDDYAYRASIVALRHGHILLTNRQYLALKAQLSSGGDQGIMQWHHLASGRWISEKNPGYPFLAVLFYAFGLLRVAPLFCGGLACVGLYCGARRWLGGWAGTYAVWIYCFSGAAVTFAWRATMPSFSDASLVAAAAGALLWSMLAQDARPRRRATVGLLAFFALEGAVLVRYTDVVELVVAALAVVVLAPACRLGWRTVALWFSSVALFTTGVLAFDSWAYGRATSTGYASGEITFSFSSFWSNLKGMPAYLTTSMPMWLLAVVALAWIAGRRWRLRATPDEIVRETVRRDALVALVLACGWLGLWVLYLNYTWTASQLGGAGPGGGTLTVHVIRFYLPAMGPIALLVTWLVARLSKPASWTLVAALVIGAVFSFNAMAASGRAGAGPGGPGPFGGAPGTSPVGTPGVGAPGGAYRPGGAPPGAKPPTSG